MTSNFCKCKLLHLYLSYIYVNLNYPSVQIYVLLNCYLHDICYINPPCLRLGIWTTNDKLQTHYVDFTPVLVWLFGWWISQQAFDRTNTHIKPFIIVIHPTFHLLSMTSQLVFVCHVFAVTQGGEALWIYVVSLQLCFNYMFLYVAMLGEFKSDTLCVCVP